MATRNLTDGAVKRKGLRVKPRPATVSEKQKALKTVARQRQTYKLVKKS